MQLYRRGIQSRLEEDGRRRCTMLITDCLDIATSREIGCGASKSALLLHNEMLLS